MATLTLREQTFERATLPVSTSWLLADCMEFRGKQDLWHRQRPEVLEALRQQAMIQSVESSNRIEGVTVSPDRLAPLALGKARPRDRSEKELSGYRRMLDWIYSRKSVVTIEPRTIQHLHALSHAGAGDAGQFKGRDNEIIEFLADGQRRIRFKPTPAKQTPRAVAHLCEAYQRLTDEKRVPPLLIVSTMIFDLLCIHPFRDGNGRVSRLLTTMLLLQHGFTVGRYVSLERLVEQSKEDYYHVLHECSQGWHEGRNPVLPWWNYFLGVLRRAYVEFSQQVEHSAGQPAKTELARRVILSQVGEFTLADLQGQLPGVSPQLLKKVMAAMKAAGQLSLTGRGRGAKWTLRQR
ncbi:MAG: Fic family protein [Phycisphaeraceae bacterium]|nr:Fic family protein [Phycisphaeraceae bacterium]